MIIQKISVNIVIMMTEMPIGEPPTIEKLSAYDETNLVGDLTKRLISPAKIKEI